MVPKPPDVRVFEALANRYRRQLLLALQDANPQRDDDLDPLDLLVDGQSEADLAVSEVELKHNHIPKLADMGFVEWDRETGTLSKGTNWSEIEPLLELLRDNRDELPEEWLTAPTTDE